VIDSSDTKSRSRRCHDVWHVPCSNWLRRDSTGAHFTLNLANPGLTSVCRARFKSPLAHQYEPLLTWAYMESAASPESPGWLAALCGFVSCASCPAFTDQGIDAAERFTSRVAALKVAFRRHRAGRLGATSADLDQRVGPETPLAEQVIALALASQPCSVVLSVSTFDVADAWRAHGAFSQGSHSNTTGGISWQVSCVQVWPRSGQSGCWR
jgi:hypothetical protein